MIKVTCDFCKQCPTTVPIGELCDYLVFGTIVVCEKCLTKIVVEHFEELQ